MTCKHMTFSIVAAISEMNTYQGAKSCCSKLVGRKVRINSTGNSVHPAFPSRLVCPWHVACIITVVFCFDGCHVCHVCRSHIGMFRGRWQPAPLHLRDQTPPWTTSPTAMSHDGDIMAAQRIYIKRRHLHGNASLGWSLPALIHLSVQGLDLFDRKSAATIAKPSAATSIHST